MWIGNNSLSIFEDEDAVRTVFHAARFTKLGATVAFFWENCWIPWCARLCHWVFFTFLAVFFGSRSSIQFQNLSRKFFRTPCMSLLLAFPLLSARQILKGLLPLVHTRKAVSFQVPFLSWFTATRLTSHIVIRRLRFQPKL